MRRWSPSGHAGCAYSSRLTHFGSSGSLARAVARPNWKWPSRGSAAPMLAPLAWRAPVGAETAVHLSQSRPSAAPRSLQPLKPWSDGGILRKMAAPKPTSRGNTGQDEIAASPSLREVTKTVAMKQATVRSKALFSQVTVLLWAFIVIKSVNEGLGVPSMLRTFLSAFRLEVAGLYALALSIMVSTVALYVFKTGRNLTHGKNRSPVLVEVWANLSGACLSIWAVFFVAWLLDHLFSGIRSRSPAASELLEELPWLASLMLILLIFRFLGNTKVSLSWALMIGCTIAVLRCTKNRGYISGVPDPYWEALTIVMPTAAPICVALLVHALAQVGQRQDTAI